MPHVSILAAVTVALVSLYLGLNYPEVFGRLAVMSPSVWWDNKLIVRKVKDLKAKPPIRIWLDVGALEAPLLRDVKDLRDTLIRKGWTVGADLMHFEAPPWASPFALLH